MVRLRPTLTSRRAALAALVLSAALVGCAAAPHASSGPPAQSSPLGQYLAGRHAQAQRDYDAAADFMARALAEDPDNFELLSRTFLLALVDGSVQDAKALAARILAKEPAAPLPQLVSFVDTVARGAWPAARQAAGALPREGVHRFIQPLALAWSEAGLGNKDAAVAALDALSEPRPLQALRDLHTALIQDLLGDADAARQSYAKIIAAMQRPTWRLIDAAANFHFRHGSPDEAQALYRRFADEGGDRDLVEARLARAQLNSRPLVGDARAGMVEAFYDLASLLNQNETADLALIYAQLALTLDPEHQLSRLVLADIHEAQRRPEEALAIYRSVPASSLYAWSSRLRAASMLNALGRTDEAIAALESLAAEFPDKPQPLVQLGDLLRGKNRFEEAIAAYDRAIARVPNPEARNWSLFYSRGVALERARQWPRAEADFKRALELQPEQPFVLNYLGYSWVEKNTNLQEAMRMIERAVQLRPNDGYIIDSLGWAHYQLGNYAEAVRHLERAVELRPQDPTINDHLGDAYWRTGRHTEARFQWRRALQFEPEADQVKGIEAKLDFGLQPAASAEGARGG